MHMIGVSGLHGPGDLPEPFRAGPPQIACKVRFSIFKFLVDDFILVYWSYLPRGQDNSNLGMLAAWSSA
jgi:hypothetical protein